MPVITRDITLRGKRREEVFAWLSERDHHRALLEGAFEEVVSVASGTYDMRLHVSGSLTHRMIYEFVRLDQEHGGRRVCVRTTGRRARGELRYGLREARPATDTLVTLHFDYAPGRALGILVDRLMLRAALEAAFDRVLQNLASQLASA